ncbi:MAG: PEP-CTERM sorting domain-containing protein [Planctomycetota bacterium]
MTVRTTLTTSLFATGFFVPMLAADVSAVELTSTFSAQVEEDEIDAFSGAVDQAFFNVQGDDDEFTVYSLVDFDTSPIIGPATSVTALSLDIAQSNIFFTANGGLEFFLATDTRAIDLNDSARYISDGDNTGSEVVGSAFGTLYSIGTGTFTETATGDIDTYTFSLDPTAEAFALSQINSGGLLRIIATPSDLAVQATYAGASALGGISSPVLTIEGEGIAIPEPTSLLVFGAGAGVLALRRRRTA